MKKKKKSKPKVYQDEIPLPRGEYTFIDEGYINVKPKYERPVNFYKGKD